MVNIKTYYVPACARNHTYMHTPSLHQIHSTTTICWTRSFSTPGCSTWEAPRWIYDWSQSLHPPNSSNLRYASFHKCRIYLVRLCPPLCQRLTLIASTHLIHTAFTRQTLTAFTRQSGQPTGNHTSDAEGNNVLYQDVCCRHNPQRQTALEPRPRLQYMVERERGTGNKAQKQQHDDPYDMPVHAVWWRYTLNPAAHIATQRQKESVTEEKRFGRVHIVCDTETQRQCHRGEENWQCTHSLCWCTGRRQLQQSVQLCITVFLLVKQIWFSQPHRV